MRADGVGGTGSLLGALFDIEWPSSERDVAYAVLNDAFGVVKLLL